MFKLTDDIKRMLNGLASSDAGEFLSMSQKASHLNSGASVAVRAAAAPLSHVNNRKRIALFLGSELPPEITSYIVQTCTRLQHDLIVLTFQTQSEANDLLKPYLDELAAAKIDMQLEVLHGDPVTGLSRFLRRTPGIAFMACNEGGYLGRGLLSGTQRYETFPVPVVLIASRSAKAPAATQDAADAGQAARQHTHVA